MIRLIDINIQNKVSKVERGSAWRYRIKLLDFCPHALFKLLLLLNTWGLLFPNMFHSLCAQKTEEEVDKSECPWLLASEVHQDKGEKIICCLCTWSLMSHQWSKGCIWLGQLSEHSATWFWDGILESFPCVATL